MLKDVNHRSSRQFLKHDGNLDAKNGNKNNTQYEQAMDVQDSKTALDKAAENGDIEKVKEFLSTPGCQVNQPDKFGRTALHRAAIAGNVEVIKSLIAAKCDVDKQDEHGNTAIHECAWRGFSQSIEALCRAQANVYIKNKGAFAPLHLACQNGHNQSCRVLLLAGCKPNIKNNYGDTAIHAAARYGHAGVMRILISGKSNVNESNKNGDTGLHISAAMGRRKLTRILLEAGCNQNIKNKQNEKAIDISRRKENSEIVEILSNPPPRVIQVGDKDESKKSRKKRSSESRTSKDDSKDGETKLHHVGRCSKKNKNGHRVQFEDVKHHKKCIYKDEHNKLSPYGCHYAPNLTSFPPPKLDTLPNDPLQKGEQYYLDLAGNIKKGPVGIGYACYCIPFFKQVEKKLESDKLELMDHIDSAHEDLNTKISSLERRTRSQLFNLTQTMKEKLAGEKTDCLERVERRTLKERLELEKQQEIAADYIKTELKSWVQSKIDHLKRGHVPALNSSIRSVPQKDSRRRHSRGLIRSKSQEVLSESNDHELYGSAVAIGTRKNDREDLGAKPKYPYVGATPNKMSQSDGDLTVRIPTAIPDPNASMTAETISNDTSPNSNHSESGYGSRATPNGTRVHNQPDIISGRPVISYNTVGLPNSEMINTKKYGDIPEPEFRITRQFFDTVSNQMEKWYERRLSSMERKSEEKSQYECLALKDRIKDIETRLVNLKPASGAGIRDNSASLV